jgi:transaldolase
MSASRSELGRGTPLRVTDRASAPRLDDLARSDLLNGTMLRLVSNGVPAVTANPTIVARAQKSSDVYDDQIHSLLTAGRSVEDVYWDLATTDVATALEVLRPTFDSSDGGDGFVSIEVAPDYANDTEATQKAARDLHDRIREPNLLVKIPATAAGVPAIEAMTAEGRSINVTLIFSLTRYAEVLEAYLAGLEALASSGGDLSSVHSVASFFVSRVDTEVDRRLEMRGANQMDTLRGQAAVAQAKLAYRLFRETHSGERWNRLAAKGARVQRPLWASTSTKNPRYPDTLYVDQLIGPDTVSTLPENTIRAFEDHGTLARTIDVNVADAERVMHAIATAGVDMHDVGQTLEDQGVGAFQKSFDHVLGTLAAKHHALTAG